MASPAIGPLMLAIIVLLFCAAASAAGLVVTCEAPGNLFAADAPPRFTVTSPQAAECAWEAASYWGQAVASGKLSAGPEGARLALEPQPPGYYLLRVRAGEETATARLGVVVARGDQPLDHEGRVCVDAAAAWLVGPDQWAPLAKMVRLAGIPWVRERFSWGEVSRTPATLDWGKYDTVADAFRAEGVNVYQIFHDSPGWAREQRGDSPNVADLRDFYRLTKDAAAHFAGRIQAWEVWNEPDIGFFPDLADRFAGIQKACYLGLKAGDPEVPVLQGSFCRGLCRFDEALYEQGLAAYYDIFNWHIYNTPAVYPTVLGAYRGLLDRYHVEERPIWLTEAGIAIRGTIGDKQQFLSEEDERRQCRFVAPSVVMSLIAGTDRHFFFVLPYYLENGVQFGLLQPDLTPNPGFLALSATANILGRGEYLGQLASLPKGVEGRLFAAPRGNVLVVWAEAPTDLSLDLGAAPTPTVADLFGREAPAAVANGRLALKAGPEAQFVIGLGDAVRRQVTGSIRPRGVLPRHDPAPVVLVGRCDLPTDKGRNVYRVKAGGIVDYQVDAYNFSETAAAKGVIRLRLPEGWTRSRREVKLALQPLDRQSLRFRLVAREPALEVQSVRVEGEFPGLKVGSAVSDFTADITSITPLAEMPLSLAVGDWVTGISGNGTASQEAGPGGEYVLTARFDRPGDRWCYSTQAFATPQDLSRYDAVGFEFRAGVDDEATRIRFQIAETGGARYYTDSGAPAKTDWQTGVFLLRDMAWGAFGPPDPNGKLDLGQAASIQLGLNTARDEMRVEFRGLKLLRLR